MRKRTLFVELVDVGGLVEDFSGLSGLFLLAASKETSKEASSAHLLLRLGHEGISLEFVTRRHDCCVESDLCKAHSPSLRSDLNG